MATGRPESPLRHAFHATRDELDRLVEVAQRGERAATGPPRERSRVCATVCRPKHVVVRPVAQWGRAIGRSVDFRRAEPPPPCQRSSQEGVMETLWAIVAFAWVVGLLALPFVLLALLWRAAGRPRPA
jgi:hypothetical protein